MPAPLKNPIALQITELAGQLSKDERRKLCKKLYKLTRAEKSARGTEAVNARWKKQRAAMARKNRRAVTRQERPAEQITAAA